MGRYGTIVHKVDKTGNEVTTYTSVDKASKKEKVSRYFLVRAIASRQPINGHLFSITRPKKGEKRVPLQAPSKTPWEGKDGFFDVSAWARVCF